MMTLGATMNDNSMIIDWDCVTDEVTNTVPTLKLESVNENSIEEASRLLPYDQIECFKKQTNGFEVVTFDQCEQALSMAMQSRKLSKVVDKKRKEITRPHLDFQRSIKKIADSFIDELKHIEASMTEKVEAFNKARKEKAEEIGVDLSTVDSVEDGTSYDQSYWEFEISKIEDIPKEYLKLDDRAVKQALSDGIRCIEGIRIFKTSKKKYRIK